MLDLQDACLCRDLADGARIKADTETDGDLQQTYLELAQDYQMLAKILERIQLKKSAVTAYLRLLQRI
jgi:hypothetical protein